MKSKSILVLCSAILLTSIMLPGRAGAYTITLTGEDIQAQVEQNFPVEEKNMFSSLTLQNPRVELKEGTDRVGLVLDAAVKALGGIETNGVVHLDGALRYVRENGEFLLVDAVARKVEIDGASEVARRTVAQLITAALRDYFDKNPIYKFDPKDMTQVMIMSALKSVKVSEGKLMIEFAMPY
ncbi:MAG: DUF1439 domain-containing protein [Nitrospinota bacterium]|nr:DUF1439 domain-containing protein [Nitrospinota bacterium]